MNDKFIFIALTITLLMTGYNHYIININSKTNKDPRDDYSAKIDSLIETKNPRNFNGIVLITQKGKIKYVKAIGYSDFDKKTPLTLKDNFRIQSNSKQITAVLVLKEAEKGNLSLEKPIGAYLPNLNQTWADTVTV
ncbi:MAG: beta-lactamase family protein [Bacteroidetes Order II. Incertae sedis bacterium]|nr:beta-lactamase family protein [Bacteroidetes Order II. bacterium]